MASVLTKADLVWNRALSSAPVTGIGDRHLRAMAKPYGRIMNSGVASVLDTSTPTEVNQAADAFAYLGLADLADLTRRLITTDWSPEGLERRLNHAFYGLDYALIGAFERKYAESPQDFDPVTPDGVAGRPASWPERDGCAGELIVHENSVECSQGDACPTPTPDVLHSRSRLHTATVCPLCPSGPTWAGQAMSR